MNATRVSGRIPRGGETVGNCDARIVVGDQEFACSLVEHDGQHYAVGMTHVKQPRPAPLIGRDMRIAYRVAWSDDPFVTLEV